MTQQLSESSLEDLFIELGKVSDTGKPIRVNATHIVVTCGRIVRVGWLMWYWMRPGRNRWQALGPYWTYRGCVGATHWLPTAPGWAHWRDVFHAFKRTDT